MPTPADARAPRPTGWQLYDAARRAEQTARETAGASIEIELATRPSTPLSALATEMRPSFVVVDADAPCRAWQDSQAARLLEQEQWPVLVVPRDAPIPV